MITKSERQTLQLHNWKLPPRKDTQIVLNDANALMLQQYPAAN